MIARRVDNYFVRWFAYCGTVRFGPENAPIQEDSPSFDFQFSRRILYLSGIARGMARQVLGPRDWIYFFVD